MGLDLWFYRRSALLVLILLVCLKPSMVPDVYSINVGDRLVYEVGVIYVANQTEGGHWLFIELKLNGTVTLVVKRIDVNELTLDIEVKIDKHDLTVDTNHPEKEQISAQWRAIMGFLISMLSTGQRGVKTPINAIIYPHEEALTRGPLSVGNFEVPTAKPRLVDAKTTIYMGRRVLHSKYDLSGGEADVSGLMEIYVDTASGVVIEAKASITGRSQGAAFSLNASVKLKDLDVIRRMFGKEYRVEFINGTGRLSVTARNLSLELIRIEGTKLTIKFSGSGVGSVFIELPKGVNVREVNLEGVRTSFTLIETEKTRFIGFSVPLSTRIVEIHFDQEIRSLGEEKPTYPLFAAIALVAVVAAAVAAVAVIMMRLKKTSQQAAMQQPPTP